MARVILDIFSGRPNPEWVLDEDRAREIVREIANTPGAVAPADDASGILGYRGLVVDLESDRLASEHSLAGRFRVGRAQRGLAERIVAELGRPRSSAPVEGFAPLEDLDLVRLLREDGEAGGGSGGQAATRSLESDASTAETSSAEADTSVLAALNPAPVLGTDASSYSTIAQGSCSIEVAAFNPNFWNAAGVQPNNNCYNYATNRRTDTFAQPGRAAGAQATRMRCSNVTTGAVADGNLQSPSCAAAGQEPRWYMALVIWPGVDYHWYRKSQEGFWGHKPGQTAARNTDNSNVVITNPETANRGGYRDFCGYFFCRSSVGIR